MKGVIRAFRWEEEKKGKRKRSERGSEMSGASSSVEATGLGFRAPFTAAQWKELEQQALIYKYLVGGLPVPTQLVVPIQQSFESISARFFQQSSCKNAEPLAFFLSIGVCMKLLKLGLSCDFI